MATTVAKMTKEEFKELIAELIEEKLLELIGDPDENLPMRKSLHDRLLRQKKAVGRGERGEPMREVVKRLGLA